MHLQRDYRRRNQVVKISKCRRVLNKLFVSNNYYKSIQPMFFFTYMYGITPFRVASDRYGCKSLRTTWFGYINPILHIVSLAISYCHTLTHNESLIGYFLRTDISNFGNNMLVFCGLFGASLVYISAVLRKKNLLRAIRLFMKVDRHFEHIQAPRNYTTILRNILTVLGVAALLDISISATCFYCLKEMDVHPSPYLKFIFIADLLGISISISLFSLLALSVNRRCALLNKSIGLLAALPALFLVLQVVHGSFVIRSPVLNVFTQ